MRPVSIIVWPGATFAALRPYCAAGKLPNLTSLIDAGACGTLRATPRTVSPDLLSRLNAAGRRVICVAADDEPAPTPDTNSPLDAALDAIRELTAAAVRLWSSQPWDCAIAVYGNVEADSSLGADARAALYAELDQRLAELAKLLPPEATLLITSHANLVAAVSRPCDEGLFIACGPNVRAGLHLGDLQIGDFAAVVLHLLDLPPNGELNRRMLGEIFSPADAADRRSPSDTIAEPTDDAIVLERLRSLGYIE